MASPTLVTHIIVHTLQVHLFTGPTNLSVNSDEGLIDLLDIDVKQNRKEHKMMKTKKSVQEVLDILASRGYHTISSMSGSTTFVWTLSNHVQSG
ncbi:hypothetical protein L596_012066 [Steinernema carpocapsae]|uniref:Uncharacterized protein n=1 Tax=Steinernema carpocapsae TaxID=34508 RepID=A0A4U5NVX4_STECR|nr:hypothetical protein L596_012066 [Steinernema carpocapsae]